MKKRYIVSINNSTPAQEEAFIAYIRKQGFGWWHWLTNTWLISDTNAISGAGKLRDDLKKIFVNEHTLVIEITGTNDTWAGFGRARGDKGMFEWLRLNWKG